MRYLHRHGPVSEPWCEKSQFVADGRRDPRLVMCRERAHAITEPIRDQRSVVCESEGCGSVGPAIVITLQRSRQVPVVERREGFNIALEQTVNQTVVEIH